MTTLAATDLNTKPIHQSSFGNAVIYEGKYSVAANPTANDVIRALRIPGGTRITKLEVLNDDLDTDGTPEIAVQVGFTPVNSADGPTADPDYWWATGATILGTAGRNVSLSDPITFAYDVWVDILVEVDSQTFQAGDIHVIAEGYGVGR